MAIIAVLVAISIPVFTSQLHKARVAADWANVRAYYAELQYDFMETGKIDNSKLHEIGTNPIGLTSFFYPDKQLHYKKDLFGFEKKLAIPKDITLSMNVQNTIQNVNLHFQQINLSTSNAIHIAGFLSSL